MRVFVLFVFVVVFVYQPCQRYLQEHKSETDKTTNKTNNNQTTERGEQTEEVDSNLECAFDERQALLAFQHPLSPLRRSVCHCLLSVSQMNKHNTHNTTYCIQGICTHRVNNAMNSPTMESTQVCVLASVYQITCLFACRCTQRAADLRICTHSDIVDDARVSS